MASIENPQLDNKKNTRITKPSQKNINIDMTPMVDLGFLLITFFIFTTSMYEPNAMELVVPKPDTSITEIDPEGVLHIILSDKNAFVYEGKKINSLQPIHFNNLREKIVEKKKKCQKEKIQNKFMVLIKPYKTTNYQRVVDVLDEMNINEVTRYALVAIEQEEVNFINNKPL